MPDRLVARWSALLGLTVGAGLALAGPVERPPGFEVSVLSDIAYHDAKDSDPIRHTLDLYLPKGEKDVPVLMFWHGGSWVHGNKSYFGMVSRLCERLARNGIAAVSANYRLKSPHPAHMEDVARAFAWVHKNIAGHGGRPDQVFVGGHSAGGHLASLLAVDPTYLQAVKLTPDVIKGVLPMSGVFRLPDQVRTFEHAFGTDPEKRKDAMPFFQVGRLDPAAKPKLPPFLILYASYDFELCGKEHADAFCRALCDKKCNAEVCLIKNRNHSTILLNSGRDDDPAGTAMIDFIRAKTKP